MECRVCFESMTSLLDGELSDSDREAIESHVAGCSGCFDEFRSLSYSFQLMNARLADDLDPPLWERIESHIKSPPERWYDRIWFLEWSWRPVAALSVLLVGFLIPWYWPSSSEQADLRQRFTSYIEEREQLEIYHNEISNIEPVGWVHHNPYAVDARSSQRNPYARN